MKEAQLARGLFAEQIACRCRRRSLNPPHIQSPIPSLPAPKSIPNEFAPPSRWRSTPRLPAMIQEITERVLIALGH